MARARAYRTWKAGTVDNKLIYTATAQKPIREHFTPRSDKRISGISFATAASVAGRLQWRILDGNTELASGYVNENRPTTTRSSPTPATRSAISVVRHHAAAGCGDEGWARL